MNDKIWFTRFIFEDGSKIFLSVKKSGYLQVTIQKPDGTWMTKLGKKEEFNKLKELLTYERFSKRNQK